MICGAARYRCELQAGHISHTQCALYAGYNALCAHSAICGNNFDVLAAMRRLAPSQAG